MLNAYSDRLDYGKHLQPPPSYELDCAIATTYSLDLEALMTIPVALCFSGTLEGDLRGEKLALLEAIGQLKGRIKVFYQVGKVKLPTTYNRLFALLEPYIQPVLPSGGVYSSFHPKLWLLRYVSGEDVKYRLLVLSRNLTFDRSWDVAVSLDGKLMEKGQEKKNRWTAFVEQLLKEVPDFEAGQTLSNELGQIQWQSPEDFWDPRLIPGDPELGIPLDLMQPNDKLLVVSPFLKDSAGCIKALEGLAKKCPLGKKMLFSRGEELNSIGREPLEDWECFSINEDVVDGEERLQVSDQKQNLHAKIIVNQRGQTTHWHVGSANATSAALGDTTTKAPRNTEFMVRLTGRTTNVGPDVLFNEWVGDNETPGIFVPHKFEDIDSDSVADIRNSIRKVVHQLTQTTWGLVVTPDELGSYFLSLRIGTNLEISNEIKVEVGQLAIEGSYKALEEQLFWKGVSLNQISALVPIRVLVEDATSGKGISEQLIIQAQLKLPEGVSREKALLSDIVSSEYKFLNYVRLLLQQHPDKNEWLGYDSKEGDGESDGLYVLLNDSPLFEQLMNAAASNPALLERVSKLLKRLHGTGVPIPKSFNKLWPHFENMVR